MAYSAQDAEDPLVSFQFGLDLGGTLTGFFAEVSGVGSESEVVERKMTDENGNDFVRKIPGRLTYTDVTLRRGVTATLDIWEWRQTVEEGKITDARKNCSLIMFDASGAPAARWDFLNAWPSKVSGPEMKTDSNDFAVEELVLVHEGLKRVAV
jgi:phage tail-like protein